jgi:hypothetical protein
MATIRHQVVIDAPVSREWSREGQRSEDLPMNYQRIELKPGPSGQFSARSADLPRIVGPHISRRIAAPGPYFQPTAGRAYDIDPGSTVDF